MYSVDKLMQTAHEAPQEEAEACSTKRKRRDSGDKKIERHARDGTTKWTDTTCKCSVEKHTKEELKAHIQRRHDDGRYMCPYCEGLKPPLESFSQIDHAAIVMSNNY